ncbi:VOC family protein [Pedobacter nototheniae]|uniref:VOC family protein n=1 Tax=Pedobacter nototheniae TaxID=2488994 RepID=UPI00103ACBD4|nr:VOC family protein [Pedobacter nototheniae]
MATTNTYLTFDGTCEEAFNFYKSIFGGEFGHLSRFSQMPQNLIFQVEESQRNHILYISLPIGNSCLMGCDVSAGSGSLILGNNFSVSVSADSRNEADRVFNGFAQFGQISTPLTDKFWGAYFGMVVDQFGINWMISFEKEMDKR